MRNICFNYSTEPLLSHLAFRTGIPPVERPGPCTYGEIDLIRYNVAPQATITSSSAVSGFPAQNVADGTPDYWNSVALSPQWVELALAVPKFSGPILSKTSPYIFAPRLPSRRRF